MLTSKGQSAIGQDQDDTVVVPYTTVQKKLTGNTYLSNLTIEAASEDEIQAVAGAVSTSCANATGCSRARPTTSRSGRWRR